MPRFFSVVLLLCLTFNAQAADSYIPRLLNKPVPGGVAVIELGSGAQAGDRAAACDIIKPRGK